QMGIKAELDLRTDSEAKDINRSVLGSGVTYKRTPLGQTQSHMEGLTNSKAIYKTALQYVLTCVRNDKPVYFHCAIGRDRTGTLAFLLEGVLGMSKSDIYKDYELTNFSYFNTPCNKKQLDDMFAAVEEMEGETLADKFRKYLVSYIGIPNTSINTFREKMLEEADDPNGIFEIQGSGFNTQNGSSAIFNLWGQRLSNMQKGINIVQGKKILVE
ncbi:MAG: tyrosine-protein phosphatase, partial [Bacteroidaceae bacterium]|nr:tyrosine-protein phosphatase [Bacteroidaceae bacterium]